LLCMHHCAEGATVGPGDFTFTTARDVVRLRDVPPEFAAVLSGHIHRQQVLTEDLRGRPVDVPVLYPGSVERTAYAEMGEEKGYFLVDVEVQDGRPRVTWDARALYARPMVSVEVDVAGRSGEEVDRAVREIVAGMPEDAVLRVRVTGALGQEHFRVLRASYVRRYAPPTMNVEIQAADEPFRRRRSTREAAGSNDTIRPQLDLGLLHRRVGPTGPDRQTSFARRDGRRRRTLAMFFACPVRPSRLQSNTGALADAQDDSGTDAIPRRARTGAARLGPDAAQAGNAAGRRHVRRCPQRGGGTIPGGG